VTLVKPLAELKVPPTVQAILAARIDRLPPAEKDLLQTLAVLGKEFPLILVREVTAQPDDELEGMLQNLQLAEFIYEQPAFPDPEYSFKHALTQEVAYNSVLTERRRILHGRIGTAIEKLHADRIEDHLAELAHHFARSADTAKAVEYLLRAGQSAGQRSASRQALERLEPALNLLESLPASAARDKQELEIRGAMWLPLLEVRGPASPESWSNMKRAQDLCDQGSAPTTLVFQVLHGLWGYYLFIANFEMARNLAGQLLGLGKRRSDEIASMSGHLGLGVIGTWTGEYRVAATSLEQSIAIGERLLLGCPQPMLRHVMSSLVSARGMLSVTLWMLGYPEQALRQIELSNALPQDLYGSFDRALIVNNDFQTKCQFLRDYNGARENAEALKALARDNGFSFFEAYDALWLGYVALEEGAIEDGVKLMLQGREALRTTGEISMSQEANAVLAQAFLTAGRATEGLAVVSDAIAAADQLQIRFYEAELHRLRGELLLLAGAPESDAEASMRRAIAIAQRQEAQGWVLRAATSLAGLLRKQGRIAEARDVLAPVYKRFTEGFDTADLKDAKALLEELGT
jgi:tetratricopeptide (TPR) repeat protein